ncbi:MAG: hypothetical protein LBO67_05615 [Spirochaetaceae bacterium]|nr:hypothetical protein [Spirochaetaceae bacterium]
MTKFMILAVKFMTTTAQFTEAASGFTAATSWIKETPLWCVTRPAVVYLLMWGDIRINAYIRSYVQLVLKGLTKLLKI